jgi:hypothetical protein
MPAETRTLFGDEYLRRLFDLTQPQPAEKGGADVYADRVDYINGLEVIDALSYPKFAYSSTQLGEAIPYVRLGDADGGYPALYVPGFAEGIEAKAPFAVEMAMRGVEMILPGQNRRGTLKDPITGRKSATYTQARNYMDVLAAENLLQAESSVDIITHSYGSLIFDEMVRIAKRWGLNCFEDVNVVMMAPAGFNEDETLPWLFQGFVCAALSERKNKKEFEDVNGEMLRAGTRNFFANVPRALREITDLATRRVDYKTLMKEIGQLTVLTFAEDDLFSDQVLGTALTKLVEAGGAWAEPNSLHILFDEEVGPLRAGHGAIHNDDQFNPSRVGGAAAQILLPH